MGEAGYLPDAVESICNVTVFAVPLISSCFCKRLEKGGSLDSG